VSLKTERIMKSKRKAVFKTAIALLFFASHFANAGAMPDENACNAAVSSKNAKLCEEAAAAASSNQIADANKGMNQDAAHLQGQNTGQMILSADGVDKCKKAVEGADGCAAKCEGLSSASKKKCDRFASYKSEMEAGVADNTTTNQGTQATQDATGGQPQSTGGGGDMMGMLMGAAMGGMLGYMLGKKMNEDKDKDKGDDDDALLPNGQIDCSKKNAYEYRDCTAWLEQNCINDLDSQKCQKFSNIYCAATSSSPAQTGDAPPMEAGSGLGSPFCKKVNAHNYCKAQGRQSCPSCLGLARSNSPACLQDPSLCLAQNSPEQINAAKQTCPTDPAFADPAYANGGGSQVPPAVAGGGLPAVVLPQSVSGSAQTSGASSASTSSGTSYSTSSSSGSAASEGAVREGQTAGAGSGSNYGSGGSGAVAGSSGGGGR
jgi:hypothetical protein